MKEEKPFKKLTYRLAVLAKCRQCAVTSQEIKKCVCTDCALYPFRLGKPPKKPVNALDLLVFNDDPDSKIFRIRRGSSEDDDPVMIDKEYPAFIEDEE